MNAVYMSSLKVFACGVAALALTAIMSWSFVESTSVARWASTPTSGQIAEAVTLASHATQSSVAALVD